MDPVQNQTARHEAAGQPSLDRVEHELAEDIALGRLYPKERLLELAICERFKISRYGARKVLQRLEETGLVQTTKNVGATVNAYTKKEITELYVMREMLELGAARLIALPVAEEDLAEIVATQQTHAACAKTGDLAGVLEANIRFHRQVFALTHNTTLTEAIDRYATRAFVIRFQSLRAPELLQRAVSEHQQIIDALRAGDRSALIGVCQRHLQPSKDVYLKTLEIRSIL